MRKIAVVLAALSCASCAMHHYALIPPPGNTAWDPDPNSAIVLVGITADEMIGSVSIADDIETVALATYLFPVDEQNTLAIHMHTGETFRLTAVNYFVNVGSASKHMVFDDLPAVTLNESGIYYYGNIHLANDRGVFSSDFDPNVVSTAERLYPIAFSHLQPVNF